MRTSRAEQFHQEREPTNLEFERARGDRWKVVAGVLVAGILLALASSPGWAQATGWRVSMVACEPKPNNTCYVLSDKWQPLGGYDRRADCLARRAEVIDEIHAIMARHGMQIVVTAHCVRVGKRISSET